MKLTRVTKIGLAALGAGLLLWVVLLLLSGGDTKTGAVVDDQHCPECGRELPRKVSESGGECPFCKAEGKTVNAGKGTRGGNAMLRGPAIPIAIVSACVVLLLVNVVFLVRRRVGVNKDEVLYYVSCRKCGRKLRYRERQAGQFAKCPLCHTVIVFPRLPEAPKPWPRRVLNKLLRL